MLHRRNGMGTTLSRAGGDRGGTETGGEAREEVVHASAVALAGTAVLIRGASGAGKSGLALRLIALGADLVADDRVILARRGGRIVARAPEPIRGLIEARGVGLLRCEDPRVDVEVSRVVDLDLEPAARMPQLRVIDLLGIELELISGRGVPNLDAVLVFMMRNGRYAGS